MDEQHKNGELELWFFDEVGFDLEPKVPYAWQPIGETIEVPCSKSSRLNVLGFLTPDNQRLLLLNVLLILILLLRFLINLRKKQPKNGLLL